MDKRTKRRIDKKVSDFERECLMEMLFESEDENVKDALEQALIAVKLIHSEEIAEEVEKHRQELIEEEKNKKNGLRDMERLIKEIERDLERKEQDIWKKIKPYDYWEGDYKWTTNQWITTSIIGTDKSPKTVIDPIKLFGNWSTKLGKK